MGEKYYLYTTISSNVTQAQINAIGGFQQWVETTLAYRLTLMQAHNLFFNAEPEIERAANKLDDSSSLLVIDTISGYQRKHFNNIRKRNRLYLIPEMAENNDVFIITSDINQFGDTAAEIQEFYKICREKHIGITIFDSTKKYNISKYSTCQVGFAWLDEQQISDVYKAIDNLTDDDIQTLQGKNNKDFPPSFIDAYFAFEAYIINDIASEISGLSINTFHSKATQLETSNSNILIEYQFANESRSSIYTYAKLQKKWYSYHHINDIRTRPKRCGVIPKNFDKLVQFMQTQAYTNEDELEWNMIEYCKEINVPIYSLIDYYRYVSKQQLTSRKELFALYKEYYNQELIDDYAAYKAHIDSLNISTKEKKQLYTEYKLNI